MKSLALLLVGLAACSSCQKTEPADAPEAARAVPSTPVLPKVHLARADGTEASVTVEVVRGEEELRRGLMHRRHLAPDRGMLFLMGEERVHTFWMKNTYIPLDMIFIGKDLTVAGIVRDVPPETLEQRYVDAPSVYVLEVNAGWTAKHGIDAGAKVRFENVRP